VPLGVIVFEDQDIGGIRRIKLSFAVEKNDRVPAYLFIPSVKDGPVPGILCLHQTISIGKLEPAGLGGIGAIAPRALFINAPVHDSNFDISGVHDCVDAAKPVFELLIAGEKLIITTPDAPHDFPPEARNEAYLFLDSELGVNNK
jgi:hypothetical protein